MRFSSRTSKVLSEFTLLVGLVLLLLPFLLLKTSHKGGIATPAPFFTHIEKLFHPLVT